jgi:hypothetical protein
MFFFIFPKIDQSIGQSKTSFKYSYFIFRDINRWNATGFLELNKTCTDEDVITFNGENYRQLCSPIIELGRIDSVRFTLSTGKH